MKKMLIVYYSWSNGNTEKVAKMLKEKINADLLRIDTELPYSGTYEEVVNRGQDEVKRHYMPRLKEYDVNINGYDIIALGTPTWWYTMAPAMLSFIRNNDFKDKIVVPFMTNGGWPGHVINDIKKECVGAKFKCSMKVRFDSESGNKLITPIEEIDKWISEVSKLL